MYLICFASGGCRKPFRRVEFPNRWSTFPTCDYTSRATAQGILCLFPVNAPLQMVKQSNTLPSTAKSGLGDFYPTNSWLRRSSRCVEEANSASIPRMTCLSNRRLSYIMLETCPRLCMQTRLSEINECDVRIRFLLIFTQSYLTCSISHTSHLLRRNIPWLPSFPDYPHGPKSMKHTVLERYALIPPTHHAFPRKDEKSLWPRLARRRVGHS